MIVKAELCPGGYACNPGNNCTFKWYHGVSKDCVLCQQGSSDRLCSRCQCDGEHCYYMNYDFQCLKCPNLARVTIVWIVLLASLIAILSLGIWFYKRQRRQSAREEMPQTGDIQQVVQDPDSPGMKEWEVKDLFVVNFLISLSFSCPDWHILNNSGKIRILIVYWQTSSLLNNRWPGWTLKYGMRFLSLFDPQTTEFGFECFLPFLSDPFKDLLTNMLLMPIILGLLILFLVVSVLWKKMKKSRPSWMSLPFRSNKTPAFSMETDENEVTSEINTGSHKWSIFRQKMLWMTNVWLFVLWFCYFQLSSKSFAVFSCSSESHTGREYVASIPWLECSSAQWERLAALSSCSIFIYVAGIPLLFAGLFIFFSWKRQLYQRNVLYSIGHFYASYNTYNWYHPTKFFMYVAVSLL